MKQICKILLIMFIGFILGCGLAEANTQYQRAKEKKQDSVAISKFLKGLSNDYGFEYTEN
jgi:hypothetical protein